MLEIKKRSKMIVPVLAVFVILLMAASPFAGAIMSSTETFLNEGSDRQSESDVPGAVDYGGTKEVGFERSGEALVSATQERLAAKILDDELDPETAGNTIVANMDRRNNLLTYNNVLSSTVNNYIQVLGSGETRPISDDSYTSNLYSTVNDYLNTAGQESGYVPYSVEMASKGYTPAREVVSERTANAKVFRNDDGTSTAIINQGAMHYIDAQGDFQDIDLTIVPNFKGEYGYKSVKNTMNTYFDSDNSGIMVDMNGNSAFSWTPVEMAYVDRFTQSHNIGDAQASTGDANGNVMIYEDSFPSTTEEYIVRSGSLKHNLILSEFPESAQNGMYLSYVGKVGMADGMMLFVENAPVTEDMETKGSIEVRGADGRLVYLLQAPFATEYNNLAERVDGTYTISFVDGEIFIAMNTPVSWLKDPARVYPIVVDPNVYATISIEESGMVYHYLYKSGTYTSESYYVYYPYQYLYIYFQGYDYTSYSYQYTYRSWGKWNTSVIPDAYTIKNIDFKGKNWYNSYGSFTANVREAPKDPTQYTSSSSTAKAKELHESLAQGRIYNASVSMPSGYYVDAPINSLGGTATQDMQDNLTSDRFFLAFHKTIESFVSTGYGYYNLQSATYAQLYVTYDPCPTDPIVDTGGPYEIPEGTNGVTLDASETFVCGSSVLYYWDTNEDSVYDIVSTQPKVFWNKNFPDDWSTNLTLLVKDLTLGKSATKTTTFTVVNVNPQIITPTTTIVGYEGQTLTIPKIEFTDPGTDTWTYFYDIDGDNIADKSGDTVESGGKYYVPSVSWYFCDDAKTVNLTVEDEDGGYSDSIGLDEVDAIYDGDINTYKRDANPSLGGTYKNMYNYDTTYPYMLVEQIRYPTSYDYDYRGFAKFDTSSLPSGFTPINVTLRTYVYNQYNQYGNGAQIGVNDISADPATATALNLWTDAGDANILDNEEYIFLDSSDVNSYVNMYLDPQNFIDETDDHSAWYGVGLDCYDPDVEYFYMYFFGGSYTTLTVSNGTKDYTLRCYANSNAAVYGYVYKYGVYARDQMFRYDTSSYMYLRENYMDYYNGVYNSRAYIKFGTPHVNQSKIIGADLKVYLSYMYGASNLQVGVFDLDYDPETATDVALWNDIEADSIYDDTSWRPEMTATHYQLPLLDSDYMEKAAAHGDWYGVGLRVVGGKLNYLYIGASEYSTYDYDPKLLVQHRVPYHLAIDVKNVDPVMDTSNMEVSPTNVKEGDEVSVTGITFTDSGPCDTHMYRVIVDLGPGVEPMVSKDWTVAEDGKLDFKFKAPDDDPDDTDSDLSKDDITVTIELRDDDYVPDFHYKSIKLVATHSEYYYYSPYKDWGVYQNLKPWDEMLVTWKNYPRSAAYTKTTPEDTVKAHGLHYYYYPYGMHEDEWDITTLAKKWIAGTEENYGLRIMPVTPGKDPMMLYSSYYTQYKPGLIFEPLEVLQPSFSLKPDEAQSKDAMLRASPYDNQAHGASYPYYLAFTYDINSPSYPESAGMIEFDLSGAPPETDESGADTVSFDMTINNVDPVINTSGMKLILEDGSEATSVKEGETFTVTNVSFKDPALFLSTEIFDYRVDIGTGYGPWTNIPIGTGGDTVVVPNAYADQHVGGNTIPLGPAFASHRYIQWYDGTEFDGAGGRIGAIGFREYQDSKFSITYKNLKIYMSHTTKSTLVSNFDNNHGVGKTLVLNRASYLYEKTTDEMDFTMFKFDKTFSYDGVSNVIWEFSFESGTPNEYRYFDSPSGVGLHRMWAPNHDDTTGTVGANYGLTTMFEFAPPDETSAFIPGIELFYPDDHPSTGTSSDDFEITIQLRDDDTGFVEHSFDITVHNVPPTVEPGKILVNGAELPADILIVKGARSSYYALEQEYVSAIEALGKKADVIYASDTQFTASNLAKYDMVIYLHNYQLYYKYYTTTYYDYFPEKDANILLDYLENHSGKLWFVNCYMYGYTYGFPTPPPAPNYMNNFFPLFGINTTNWRNNYFYPSAVMNGTGNWWAEEDEFDLLYPGPVTFSYATYVTTFENIAGTSELRHQTVGGDSVYTMVHREHSSWDAKAMITGFDLNQIGDEDQRKDIMKEAMIYFGLPEQSVVEINEGDYIELEGWEIMDPAKGEPTETFSYEIDWGDGETGDLANATAQGGINMPPAPTGPYLVVPNAYEDTTPTGGFTVPWGPGYPARRFQQLYDGDEFQSKAGKISHIGFKEYQGSPFKITYNGLYIYMSHSTATSLSSTFASNYGTDRTLVKQASSFTWEKKTAGLEFSLIPLDTSFDYDGSSNVVLEVYYTSGTSVYQYFYYMYDQTLNNVYGPSPTSTTATTRYNGMGLVTKFVYESTAAPPTPQSWKSYLHRYRDDPASGDTYTATINVYDDDLGHGTENFIVKVNNIKPTIEPQYVIPSIVGQESGSPSVQLPQVPFDDPATQYDTSDPNEVWTYWWDLDNNGMMNNAPDVIGTVSQSAITETLNHSYGKTPQVMAMVNDDYLRKPIACYILDDDMAQSMSSNPDGESGTITINNVAPTASIEAYVPMEVRVRMSGTKENDLRVVVKQTNPQDSRDVLTDEMTIERMPGQPKENPFGDGTPSAPLFVKVQLGRTIELAVTFDATPDPNDVSTNSGPNGADPVYVYLDFPMEDDYDPADDSQSSSQGHHWAKSIKFNVNQDGSTATDTTDISSVFSGKRGFLVGTSYDDSSDDAQFNWMVLSGSAPLPYNRITYYNDGSDPVVNGAFKDTYPSPWDGTAPVTYTDAHAFSYGNGFSIALYTIDDDGGRSNTATLTVL